MENNIKKIVWFTQQVEPYTLGIVCVETEHGDRKAYIGTGLGFSAYGDSKAIYLNGAPVREQSLQEIIEFLKGGKTHEPKTD